MIRQQRHRCAVHDYFRVEDEAGEAVTLGLTPQRPSAMGNGVHALHIVIRPNIGNGKDGQYFIHCSDTIDATTKYHLDDWLDLHGLTARQCESAMSRAPKPNSDCDVTAVCSRACDLSDEQAWQLAASVMMSSFPQAAELIKNVRDQAVKKMRADGARATRPFTVPIGRDKDRHPLFSMCN